MCLDYYEVIKYIIDYLLKDDVALKEAIEEGLKLASPEEKEKMKTVASLFLSHRQIGESEAIFKLLPNLHLKHSTVAVVWVATGKKAENSARWRLATKEQINKGYDVQKLKDKEGLWIETQDMLKKYLRRPNELEDIELAHFCKMYRSAGQDKIPEKDTQGYFRADEDPEIAAESQNIRKNKSDKNMNKIIKTDEPLPDFIKLLNPQPGELVHMRKRMKPAVLRFHKIKKDQECERWCLSELLLYTSYRDKEREIYENNSIEIYTKKKDEIKKCKAIVMEHLERVEEARIMMEEANIEVDLDAIGQIMDPQMEQENAEIGEASDHPDYVHLDPEILQPDQIPTSNVFKEIIIPAMPELKRATRSLDKFQREVVNIAIDYCKSLVKSLRKGNPKPEPPKLMVHGGAGAGKSTVIRTLCQWCQLILSKRGDNTDSPYIIRTSFTGTAASIIDGHTLNGAFNFSFDGKHSSLPDNQRDQKKLLFKNLEIIIIDEVSMVKADMLYQLDLKLQEVKERSNVPFGGVAIFCFGDLLQLKPVMGKFIFDRPKLPNYHTTYSLESRWEMFQVLNLEFNHRQGDDKDYAEILNRIRIGGQTEADIAKLNERVRHKCRPELKKDVELFITPTRAECQKHNNDYLKKLDGEEILLPADHFNRTQPNYKPFIDHKEGTIGTTGFVDKLQLKKGAKIIMIHNVKVSDCLTNGQLGNFIDTIKTTDGKVAMLVIKLKNKNAGQENRQKFKGFLAKYPGCILIERVKKEYTIRKSGGTVGSSASLVQFPVKLAHAITAHKIQGQTIPKPLKVGIHLDTVWDEAQGYVMLSRVEDLQQVFIVGKFDAKKAFKTSNKAMNELNRMNKICLNNNPDAWLKEDNDSIKIASLNCAGLKWHHIDIKADERLLQADLIHLNEISLTQQDDLTDYELDGFTSEFLLAGEGKGIATYYRSDIFIPEYSKIGEHFQITKFNHPSFDVINLYRSQRGSSSQLSKLIQDITEEERNTLITGDFNLCFKDDRNNTLIQSLLNSNFNQLINTPTQIEGRIIDHAYFRSIDEKISVSVSNYSPYYSDHSAVLLTIKFSEMDTT